MQDQILIEVWWIKVILWMNVRTIDQKFFWWDFEGTISLLPCSVPQIIPIPTIILQIYVASFYNLWYSTYLSRSGKSSIQKVVFHKMSPNETLFLESTNKIIKEDISNSSFVKVSNLISLIVYWRHILIKPRHLLSQ